MTSIFVSEWPHHRHMNCFKLGNTVVPLQVPWYAELHFRTDANNVRLDVLQEGETAYKHQASWA